ncbi:MAG: YlxR family protein [Bdellovibrionota bacterium]
MSKKMFTNERTCIVCKKKDDKKKLLRFVLDKNDNFLLDSKQVLSGRGAYVHLDEECFNSPLIVGAFRKAFKTNRDFKVEFEEVSKEALRSETLEEEIIKGKKRE